MKQKITRQCFRFLMLFVGLFALSNVGWAEDVTFYGQLPGGTWDSWKYYSNFDSNGKAVAKVFGQSGTVYFRVWDSNSNKNVCPKTKNDGNDYKFTPSLNQHVYGGEAANGEDGAFKFNVSASYVYTITYEKNAYSGNGQIDILMEPFIWYINGDFNNWNGVQFNGSGNTLTVEVNVPQTSGKYFKVSGNNGLWYGRTVQTEYVNGTAYTLSSSGNNDQLPSDALGKKVKFTLTINSNSPSTLKAEWSDKTLIYFYTNEDEWKTPHEIELNSNNQGSYSENIVVDDGHYLVFSKSSTSPITWNDAYRPNGTSADEQVYPNTGTTAYTGKNSDKSFKLPGGTFRLDVTGYTSDKNIDFKLVPVQLIKNDKSLAGRYFLVGNQLNNNTASPAWELVRDGSTYKLDNFAMRYSNDLGVVYFQNDGTPVYIATSVNNMPTHEVGGLAKDGYYSQAGWNYSASFIPNNASNPTSGTLTLNNGSSFNINNDMLPYIGVLGYSFTQKNQLNTLLGNTSSGWQEAYIEYNEDGYPELKSDGSAYYNTVWPPKNNILMQANIGTDALNVSSKDLTLEPVGTQSGKLWAQELTGSDYANLRTAIQNESTEYTRYIVKNVWMQGEFKLWTGWAGLPATWGANWDTHLYWGPSRDGITDWIATRGTTNGVEQVDFNTVYATSNDNWDTEATDGHANANLNFGTKRENNTYRRAYYKTMELFVPKASNGDVYDFLGSKLYLTQAPGGAQIDAIARNNKNVYYAPSLTYVPEGYYVSSYKVTRYAYDAKIESDHYGTSLNPCNTSRQSVSKNNALVVGESTSMGKEVTSPELFAKRFKNDLESYTEDNTHGDYKAGRYIFRLEVTFTNLDNASETMTADEWSPYVELVSTNYDLGLEAFQLIELPKTNNPFEGYTHITFDENKNCKLVEYDGVTLSKYDDLEDVEESVINEIYENTGIWTNKVLLISQIPDTYYSTGVARRIDGFFFANEDKNTPETQFKKIGNDYLRVEDQKAVLSEKTYNVQFDASYLMANSDSYQTIQEVTGKNELVRASADYKPHFMLPAFGNTELSFDDVERVATYTGSHEDLSYDDASNYLKQQAGVETNRHMLRAKIDFKMPNVSTADGLRDEVYKALKLQISKDGSVYNLVADPASQSFGLEYKYQNPHDWMTNKSGSWEGKTLNWNITNRQYDASKVVGVEPILYNAKSVSLTPAPQFTKPSINKGKNTFSWELTDDYKVVLRLNELKVNNPSSLDKLNDDNNFVQNENTVFMVKVTSDSKNYDGPAAVSVSKIMETNGNVISDDTPIITFAPTDINYDGKGGSQQTADMLKDLKVEVGYAYFFSAGGEAGSNSSDESQNAQISSSGYYGFTSVDGFPTIREDHDDFATAVQNLARRRAAAPDGSYEYDTDKPTETLLPGDNAFILVPEYAIVKDEQTDLTEVGMPTGIEGIDSDSFGSVKVGRGFIEVEGDNVEIYSASGMHIGRGAGRYDVAAGIYMVNLNGQIRKVLVK